MDDPMLGSIEPVITSCVAENFYNALILSPCLEQSLARGILTQLATFNPKNVEGLVKNLLMEYIQDAFLDLDGLFTITYGSWLPLILDLDGPFTMAD